MFKTIVMLKRRADLSRDEFIRRYESHHAKLGEQLLRGSATRYVRRYLTVVPNPLTGTIDHEPDHDVLMEAWYVDRDSWEASMARLSVSALLNQLMVDEETLFDRSKNCFFIVEEHESDMS